MSETNNTGKLDISGHEPGIVHYEGEEELRFIRNFHDIFLSIGLGMFLVGLAIVAGLVHVSLFGEGMLEGNDLGKVRDAVGGSAAIALAYAAAAWLLAEIFARTRRLFLPSIVIFIGYALAMLWAAYALFLFFNSDIGNVDGVEDAINQFRILPLYTSVFMSVAVFAFYFRMRLPFSLGVGGLVLASFVFSVFILVYDFEKLDDLKSFWPILMSLLLAMGLILFSLGLVYDARDPHRENLLSDNAFWLHFFAAPILFGAVTNLVAGPGQLDGTGTFPAVTTLIIVLIFAVVSLLINRRALLVSGLLSAIFAVAVLVRQAGFDAIWTVAVTLLTLGGAMVVLGGAWHSIRRVLIAPFPKTGPLARIIPPVTVDG